MNINNEDRIIALEHRLNNIENELISIKGSLSSHQSSKLLQPKSEPFSPPTTEPETATISRIQTPVEKTDNSKFFGFIASICFILATTYFIKYAIDTGWLTPLRQVGGAFLFGFTLILISLALQQKDNKYSSILAGTGIVISYMAAFAGHMYYLLYDFPIAIILANLISIGCLYLYLNFKQDYYAITAIVGTYLVPLLLSNSDFNLHEITLYFILWGLAYSVIAIALKNRLFIGITSYLGLLIYFVLAANKIYQLTPSNISLIIIFQAVQFIVFFIATIFYSLKIDNPLSNKEAWSLFPALLLFYSTEYYLLDNVNPTLAPWIALLFGLLTTVGYFIAKNLLPNKVFNSLPILATYLAFITLHAGYFNLVPSPLSPWFAIAILLIVVASKDYIKNPQAYWPAYLILSWIYMAEIFTSIFPKDIYISTIIINFTFSVLLFLLAKEGDKLKESNLKFIYLFAILELLYGERHLSIYFIGGTASYLVESIMWGITALAFLYYAKRISSKNLGKTSMTLFSIVAYKVLFIDLSNSDQGAKIISLVILGSLFYYAGYIYKNLQETDLTNTELNLN